MNNELLTGKNARLTTKNEESPDARGTSPQNITVVLPAYNEEVSIGSVVLRAKKFADRVVVVDYASSDNTVEVAELAGAQIIRDNKRRGLDFPIKTGVQCATDSETLLFMDVSICHEPKLIPKMLEPIQKDDFDMVIGTCFIKSNRLEDNVSFLNNKQMENGPVGFFVFSKECFEILQTSPNIYTSSVETILSFAKEHNLKAKHLNLEEEHTFSLFKRYKIGVVVPAFNEEVLLGETIKGIPEYVSRIYIVDDCSSDRTPEVIKNLADPRIISLRHEVNMGAGKSVIDGYKMALEDKMDIVVVMDGDNQMDPAHMPRLLMPIIEGKADYTKGNRLITKEAREGMSAWRFFGNTMLSLLTKIGSGYWDLMDPQNGYAAASRKALETIDLDSIYTYYGYVNDILIKLNAYGMRVTDVVIPARYGNEKSSINYRKYVLKVAPMLFNGFLWRLKTKYVLLSFHPLVFFYVASMALLPAGLIFDVWIIVQKLMHDPVSPNFPLLGVFMTLMGVQLLFFAMFFDMQSDMSKKLDRSL
ncbi:Glycosyltransferase [Methanosarcina mazei TMA]|uniref:glycosyltransferase family 2 protein n=1 Tax=Methanosarcina mazei TaxID=2209 RepID=UPI001C336FBF|nr:glycosyltransferase family 2 protein [Methanosarcina mazei]UWJ21494.1 Glycosyltransferase [Methanosarcina mazei TMA]BBL66261.1 dolichyl-phosphate beta-D-mannosyltransferase [Methanosarcina mazei]